MPGAPTGGNIAADQPDSARAEPSIRLVSVDARGTPQDFGAGIAGGLDSVAKGLENVSNTTMEISDQRDRLFAQQIASKAEVDWRQNLAQAEQAFTLDPSKGVNYADTYKQQFNDYQQQIMANNPDITQNAKNLVMTHLNSLGANMFGDALKLQAKASTDWSIQSFTNTSDNIKTAANGQGASVQINDDGNVTSSFDNARNQLTDLYKTANGVVPTKMVRDRLLQDHIELDKAEIDTSTEQNGAIKTAQLIQAGKLGTALTIPQRFSQIQELQRQGRIDAETTLHAASGDLSTLIDGIKLGTVPANDPRVAQAVMAYANANGDLKDVHEGIAIEAIKKASIEGLDQKAVDAFPQGLTKEGTASEVNAVANKASQIGGNIIPFDVNAITSNYGIARANPDEKPAVQIYTAQEAAQKAQAVIQSAQLTGIARQKMLGMSPDQATDYFNKLTGSLGADHPALKDIAQFESQREKLLNDNPARVALADNNVKQANDVAETLTKKLFSGDATIDPKDVQAANGNAISKIYAFQDQVGTEHTPLTTEMAQHLADAFTQGSSTSPEKAIQLKSQLKEMYPKEYLPDVLNSLPMSSKLSWFMALPDGSQVERNFAESLAVTDKDKNVSPKNKATLDKSFLPSNDPTISNFLQSQISNGYTGTQLRQSVSDTQSALRDYATTLSIKNKSDDPTQAISQAPKDVIGSVFGFTSINGQTIRIPRADGQGGQRSDSDIQGITQGLQLETDKIFFDKKETQGQNIDLKGALDRYHYQESDANHQMAVNDLKQNAYWSTGIKGLTGDNEAVLLAHDNEGNRFPVLDKQGNAIIRNLDEMNAQGSAKIKELRERSNPESADNQGSF